MTVRRTRFDLPDLAPEIVRRRGLIEARMSAAPDRAGVEEVLVRTATLLDLRTYDAPVIFAPADGDGREENAGFDAFLPLIDSGISGYFWTKAGFASILVYSCKAFDLSAAEPWLSERLGFTGDVLLADF
ncbi:MAG: hypothetical protein ACFE0P_04710 [Oceanicaulis sp.]